MKIVIALLGHVIACALVGWLSMLSLGIAHHDISHEFPALGYLPVTTIVLAVGSVIRFIAYQTTGGRP